MLDILYNGQDSIPLCHLSTNLIPYNLLSNTSDNSVILYFSTHIRICFNPLSIYGEGEIVTVKLPSSFIFNLGSEKKNTYIFKSELTEFLTFVIAKDER